MHRKGQRGSSSLPTSWRAPSMVVSILLALAISHSSAHAQTFTVIHNFSGLDGANPYAPLTMDAAGNFYGTTFMGGGSNAGTVFRLKRFNSSWVLTPIYSFLGQADGAQPSAKVIVNPDGALYGTTYYGGGGCSGTGCGTVFKLTPPVTICRTALCTWTETVLYSFSGADGANPASEVAYDGAGALYGTTWDGGQENAGTVYKLALSDGQWTESVLYSFTGGSDGLFPYAGLILDNSGNLYGTAPYGGDYLCNSGGYGSGCGTVFQLMPSGSSWNLNVLHTFHNLSDGAFPFGGLIFDRSGKLYGSTSAWYTPTGGTVFQMVDSDLSTIYNFNNGYSVGPVASLIMDAAGALYGTTFGENAPSWYGSVFKLTYSANGWTYASLHDFTGGSDGGFPAASLILDTNGNLYGTASIGGDMSKCSGSGCGVVFEITR